MPIIIGETVAYNLKELSPKIGLTIDALRRYIGAGKIRAQKVGKLFYVTEGSVRDFLEGDPQVRAITERLRQADPETLQRVNELLDVRKVGL